jgi:CheY-like chemotaxis protein
MSRILIVEDNPVNLKLARVILQHEGYETVDAADAEEAERSIQESVPDLILMDLGLPGKDGYEFTRELRLRSDTKDVPILAVTSFAMMGDPARSLRAGCNGHITKPIDRETLLSMVRNLVGPAEASA